MSTMKEYHVARLTCADWSKATFTAVDEYVWGGEYRPEVKAGLILVPDDGLYVKMICGETDPKAVHEGFYSEVWLDSCLEFFFGMKYLGNYINCEMNSAGACLIGVGDGREDRRRIDEYTDIPAVTAEKSADSWSVTAHFTLSQLKAVFGDDLDLEAGSEFYGNFFKCGEETHTPHYGMWNPIEWDHPDFHRPECFGKFILD